MFFGNVIWSLKMFIRYPRIPLLYANCIKIHMKVYATLVNDWRCIEKSILCLVLVCFVSQLHFNPSILFASLKTREIQNAVHQYQLTRFFLFFDKTFKYVLNRKKAKGLLVHIQYFSFLNLNCWKLVEFPQIFARKIWTDALWVKSVQIDAFGGKRSLTHSPTRSAARRFAALRSAPLHSTPLHCAPLRSRA